MNQENLPIELKNSQLAINKRINKRRIEGIKRVGKIISNVALAVPGLVISIVGGPIGTVAGLGIMTNSFYNTLMDIVYKKSNKEAMFAQRKKTNGEIIITQTMRDLKPFKKLKGFKESEKASMMGVELLVDLQKIKQTYEDYGMPTEPSRDGASNVYLQVYSTQTHGINIKTIEALEQLGYLQIHKKEPNGKTNLFIERMLFGQYKKAMESVLSRFTKDENKTHEVEKYDIAFKVTDKQLDFEQIYKEYIQSKDAKDKNPTSKAIKRLGIIFEALRNRNIDIVRNDIGETLINYNAQESFATRVKREQTNLCAEYRKENYIGDTIEQGPVQKQEEQQENEQEQNRDSEIER